MSSPEPRARIGLPLLATEIAVLFRRKRTWAMLLALAAVPVLVGVAIRIASGPDSGRAPSFLSQVAGNGLFVGIAALVLTIPLFLPLTVGVVAGDTIAGEAAQGTLRYLLVAPAGRARLLVVKFIGAAVFCFAAPLVVAAAGTLTGLALFPVGPVTLLSGDQVGVGEGLLRLLLLALYTGVSMLGLTAVGLFVSTLTDVPVGAMAATVVLAVTSQVLDQLPQLEAIHPFLLSDSWLGLVDLLRQPPEWSTFGGNALLQLGYVVVFGALAYGRFTTRDVLA
ncbi:ABC transporter permease [Amnibacterium setariae]|uniref:ABC transporter permease n=1 Tax=Amnibacterium setariae TaxID=2306585 RepID=A0A3A1TUX0_9MICO|nr:ABC transporter permease subunit [Amnibacterium setariae]RIX27599.1 ABC transporter permease [Amnibacterium setariae]